jgi:Flp pilus assembly protein TadG
VPAKRFSIAKDERGVSAVEFAIVGPSFIMMLIGVFVLGYSMHCISSVRLAVEGAARALEINQTMTQSQLTTFVQNKLTGVGDPNVTIALANDTSVAGVSMKKITGTYAFDIVIPLIPTQHVNFSTSVSVPMKVP